MTGNGPVHPSARRVDSVLREHGLEDRVLELPESTRTARDAAATVGCEVRQIVKSLVFRTATSARPVLVLASGDHRVDEQWMERYVGEALVRADPEFVRSVAGFAIGGVPPVGHATPLPTYIDLDLLEQGEVWAAAGTPRAICRLTPLELLRATRGRPVPVVPLETKDRVDGLWVTLDCYGTLVDWRSGVLNSLDRLLGAASPGARLRFIRAYLEEEQRIEAGPYSPYREIMIEALLAAAAVEGIALSRPTAEEVPESIPDWPLFPDTRAALRELESRGARLGVLSNIDRDLLDRTLSRHGLAVTISVTAEEVRSYKPAPAHWIRFWKTSGADPEQTWHVAGAYEYDIPTAQRLGFRTAFVTRYAESVPGGDASIVVRDLAEFATRVGVPPSGSPASSAGSG